MADDAGKVAYKKLLETITNSPAGKIADPKKLVLERLGVEKLPDDLSGLTGKIESETKAFEALTHNGKKLELLNYELTSGLAANAQSDLAKAVEKHDESVISKRKSLGLAENEAAIIPADNQGTKKLFMDGAVDATKHPETAKLESYFANVDSHVDRIDQVNDLSMVLGKNASKTAAAPVFDKAVHHADLAALHKSYKDKQVYSLCDNV